MPTVVAAPRPYELMTVLVPDLNDEDLAAQLDRINEQITAAGGTVTETLRESPWGRRRLAYTIRHNGQDYRDGFYVVTHFTMPPAKTVDLERELKLNLQIIRYLLVHDDPKAGERGRDPELVVEHRDEPQAVAPVNAVATAETLRNPEAPIGEEPAPETEPSTTPSADTSTEASATITETGAVPEAASAESAAADESAPTAQAEATEGSLDEGTTEVEAPARQEEEV